MPIYNLIVSHNTLVPRSCSWHRLFLHIGRYQNAYNLLLAAPPLEYMSLYLCHYVLFHLLWHNLPFPALPGALVAGAAARHGKPPRVFLGRRLGRYLGVLHPTPTTSMLPLRRACAVRRSGTSVPVGRGCATLFRTPWRSRMRGWGGAAHPRLGGSIQHVPAYVFSLNSCASSRGQLIENYINHPSSLPSRTLHLLDVWLWGRDLYSYLHLRYVFFNYIQYSSTLPY